MTIAALAGRRLDRPGASPPRFPRSNVTNVRKQIEDVLSSEQIGMLVSSAASGADLLALEAATKMGVRCRVVLPFEPARFRRTSVIDRSGDWGPVFDGLISRLSGSDDLIVLEPTPGTTDDESYARATEVIIDQAKRAAFPEPALALVIWDGKSRGKGDFTEQFLHLARREGMKQRTILTS